MSRWLKKLPRKRYQRVLLGIAAALIVSLLILSIPSVQKKIIVAQAQKYTESFDLQYIHILPWSVSFEGLAISTSALDVWAEQAKISFCVTKLLWRVVQVDELRVSALKLEINDAQSQDEAGDFPGVFALLNHGYRVTLGTLELDAEVRLPDNTSLKVAIPEGYLSAEGRGEIALQVQLESEANNISAHSAGTIAVSQSAEYDIEEIFTDLNFSASITQSAAPDNNRQQPSYNFAIDSLITPWVETLPGDEEAPAQVVLLGDNIELNVEIPGDETAGIELSSSVRFDARKQRFEGAYALAVAAQWIEQLIGNASAPLMSESGEGSFSFQLGELGLELDYQGDTRFTTLERLFNENPALPEFLRFNKSLTLDSDLATVNISSLATGLTANDDTTLLTLALNEPIEVSVTDPHAAIATDRKIGLFEIQQLPIEWLGGLVPETTLRDGRLSGSFSLEAKDGTLQLIPNEALTISATSITARDLPEQVVSLSMRPQMTVAKQLFTAKLSDLSLHVGEEQAAEFNMTLKLPLSEGDAPMHLRASTFASIDRIKALAVTAPYTERYPTPAGISASAAVDLFVHPDSLTVNELTVDVAHNETTIADIRSLQAFAIPFGEQLAIDYQAGRLAAARLQAIDLAWANPYLGAVLITGELASANFRLEQSEAGGFALVADDSVDIRRWSLAKDNDTLLQNIFVKIKPTVALTNDEVSFDYSGLSVNKGRTNLLSGRGGLVAARTAEGIDTSHLSLRGRVQANLNKLATLPLASAVVEYEFGKTNWRTGLSYDIDYSAKEILLSAFEADISANKQRRFTATSQGAVRVRPQIDNNEALAQHVVGDFKVVVDALAAAEIKDLIPLGGLTFDSVNTEFLLSSDGKILQADFEQPVTLVNAAINGENSPLINPFNLIVKGGLRTSGENLDAAFDEIRLSFIEDPNAAALDGDITFHINPSRAIPLEAMSANFRGDVPIILNQPAILAGHSLAAGEYKMDAQVHPDGRISGSAKFGDLVAEEALAVTEFNAQISGKMSANGKGFNFSMPITGIGKTGSTDGLLTASLAAERDAEATLGLDFSSEKFFLNDLLASIAAISKKNTKADAGNLNAAKTPTRLSEEADDKAFWDVLPLDAKLSYDIRELYYTDYVIFRSVGGEIFIEPQSLDLQKLSAYFHDSPMTFNGVLKFLPKSPTPYDVKLLGTVTDFNLNQFFSELVPGVKPRAEGLFGVSIDAFGQSPNMPQFRNNLFFDVRLQSRDGLFRPLPPDGTLMAGASDVLGVVGESLSYMPTGGFGAGALSRLVNYIKEIDYDVIDMHLTRGDSRDIVIEQFLVQSPTVRLTAAGGIDYEYGKDVLDSPLSLDAAMNMSGKGAAILYSMDLLEDAQDEHGYYHGPKFEIRGSANEPTSNFAEIISTGAKGTVAGGVTRPLSGLIGNIKHRWFGGDTKPAEVQLELTREADSSAPKDGAAGQVGDDE
ncbi:MAG: hypothetical protein ACU84Q_15650 [Gammaproteobacteria bacterium]